MICAVATRLSLAPTELDLEIYAGDGAAVAITVVDANNNIQNLTGSTIIAQVRQNRYDPGTALLSFAIDTTKYAQGIVTISLTGAQTATLVTGTNDPWRGFWDVQWTASGQQPVTLMQGSLLVDPDVSH